MVMLDVREDGMTKPWEQDEIVIKSSGGNVPTKKAWENDPIIIPTEAMAKESAMEAKELSTATRSLTEEERTTS